MAGRKARHLHFCFLWHLNKVEKVVPVPQVQVQEVVREVPEIVVQTVQRQVEEVVVQETFKEVVVAAPEPVVQTVVAPPVTTATILVGRRGYDWTLGRLLR